MRDDAERAPADRVSLGAIAFATAWLLVAAPASADCDDPALTAAAAEALASGAEDLIALARAAGSTLPTVRGLRASEGDDARVRRFVEALAARAGAPIECGEASSEGRRLVLAGPRAATLEVEADRVRVELAEGWSAPRLYVRDGEGNTYETAVERGHAALPSDLVRPLAIQIVATGPGGPRPVAEHRGLEDAPDRAVPDSDEPIPVRLRRLRVSAGVSELRPNRLLERVAARHAAEVCREGRVAHVGEGGDPVERLARAGVRARHVGEAVARASDLAGAYAAMLRSPSHRAALTDRRMTDVGVAGARGRCLVVLLAAWPRAIPFDGR
ncbi:MAG: hypothetical protein KF729_03765 [Sandaracinaceae bacterium]|nr:hypothetical protein [Sandaracinaceae bacterium]